MTGISISVSIQIILYNYELTDIVFTQDRLRTQCYISE